MTKLKDYINESLLDDEEDLVSRRLPIEYLYEYLNFIKVFVDRIKYHSIIMSGWGSPWAPLPDLVIKKDSLSSWHSSKGADNMNNNSAEFNKQIYKALMYLKRKFGAIVESNTNKTSTYEWENGKQVLKYVNNYIYKVRLQNVNCYIKIVLYGSNLRVMIQDYDGDAKKDGHIVEQFFLKEIKDIEKIK